MKAARLHAFKLAAVILAAALLIAPTAALAQAAEAAKVRVLLALDTDDNQGQCWGLDGENMKALIEHMVKKQGLEGRVVIDHFTGAKVTPRYILDFYNKLDATGDDAVMFYFSGHGGYDKKKGHFMAFRRGALYRNDLLAAMDRRKPRLRVVLTDCCANYTDVRGGALPGLPGDLHAAMLFGPHAAVQDQDRRPPTSVNGTQDPLRNPPGKVNKGRSSSRPPPPRRGKVKSELKTATAIAKERLAQLRDMMPTQRMVVRVPSGGDNNDSRILCSQGLQLRPSLVGWHGRPPEQGTESTLFLEGMNFSVHDTHVVAGGKPARSVIVSRHLLEVTVPCDASPAPSATGNPLLDITVATPNGVSNHLLIKMVPLDHPRTPPPPAPGLVVKEKEKVEVKKVVREERVAKPDPPKP